MTDPDPTRAGGSACGCTTVCSLPGDRLEERVGTIRREILPHVTRRESLPDGIAWQFPVTPALRETLDRFVAFERRCCAGLRFELEERAGALRVSIRGEGADAFAALGPPSPDDAA